MGYIEKEKTRNYFGFLYSTNNLKAIAFLKIQNILIPNQSLSDTKSIL